jgi:potassium-transporting ATPase KdpC subunit
VLKNQWRPALLVTAALMVITGLAYPGLVTAIAQLLFPRQANGSLIRADGKVVGSVLIGQTFAGAGYFHGRPSAAGYDDTLSGGTNLGPTSAKLDSIVAQAVDSEVKLDHAVRGEIPSDLVTASGSGLDPDISPASAALQIARVARERALTEAQVRGLVARHTEGRTFGLLGDPRVNVLELNLALDSVAPPGPHHPEPTPIH